MSSTVAAAPRGSLFVYCAGRPFEIGRLSPGAAPAPRDAPVVGGPIAAEDEAFMIQIKHRQSGEVLLQKDLESLQGVRLDGAKLPGANLSAMNLAGIDFQNADLREADFSEANLSGANLQGAFLDGANFREATLNGANLTDAVARRAVFTDAQLEQANLRYAKMADSDMTGVNLRRPDHGRHAVQSERRRSVQCRFAGGRPEWRELDGSQSLARESV
jgi:hypothetical protein